MRPGEQPISTAQRVPCNPDGRASAGWKGIPVVREFLINIVERNSCSRGHQPRARVHRDVLQAAKVNYDVGRLRKSFVGMASAPHRKRQAV